LANAKLVAVLLVLACVGGRDVAALVDRQDATVSGRVVLGLDGPAVADAAVRFVRRDGGGVVATVRTDENGRFIFSGLPDGRYVLEAARSGHFPGSLGQRSWNDSGRILTIAGKAVADLKVPIWKPATISGRLTDDAGRALGGIVVAAFGETVRAGRLARTQQGQATTDSRGAFRIENLVDGRYLVVAGQGFPEPVAPTFYPSGSGPAQAIPVELPLGEDRAAVDITVPRRDTFTVAGRIQTPGAGPTKWSARLTIADGDFRSYFVAGFTPVAADGGYQFANVPRGDYVVEAYPSQASAPSPWVGPTDLPPSTMPTLPATVIVRGPDAIVRTTVADQDVRVPALVIPSALTIRGRIAPEPASGASLEPRLLPRILVVSVDGHAIAPPQVSREANATFTSLRLMPGRYFVRIAGAAPSGWALSRITVGDRPVVDTPLDLRDRDIDDVVVYLTDEPAKVSGTVLDQTSRSPDPDASVLLFPVDASRWLDNGRNDPGFQSARAQPDGTFSVTGLLPGEYCVVGLKQEHTRDWNTAPTLAALAPLATKITVGAGQSVSLSVTGLSKIPGRQ
jgi:hypothetical protein